MLMVKNESLRNSERAKEGGLTKIKKTCPLCGHDKAFNNLRTIKCTRCKHVHTDMKGD